MIIYTNHILAMNLTDVQKNQWLYSSNCITNPTLGPKYSIGVVTHLLQQLTRLSLSHIFRSLAQPFIPFYKERQ